MRPAHHILSGMGDDDPTLHVLREIRDEQRATREEMRETAIRDMAEQLVMLARGIRTALDSRSSTDARVDDLERRVSGLEGRNG